MIGWRRPLGAVLLAFAGGALNLAFDVPLFSAETPSFVFGSAPVFLAFLLFGPAWGTGVAAVAMLGLQYQTAAVGGTWTLAAAQVVYLIEPMVAWWLVRRVRSLVVAVLLFWFGVGWLFDWVLYRGLVGFGGDYITLLFLKQVFNGIICAAIAETVATVCSTNARAMAGLPRPTLRQHLASRIGLLIAPSIVAIGVIYVRTSFEAAANRGALDQQRQAATVGLRVQHYLQSHHGDGWFDRATIGSVDVEQLTRLVAAGDLKPGGETTLVDGNRRTVVSTNAAVHLGDPLVADFPVPVDGASAGSFEYRPQDPSSVGAPAPLGARNATFQVIQPYDWAVVVDAPVTSRHRAMAKVASQVLAFGVLTVSAVLVLVIVAASRVARPLVRLREAAARLAAGQAPTGSPPTTPGPEIVELADLSLHFDAMAEAVRERQARSQARESELERRVAQSERLEAVGLLAGGVAHDFNNLLIPILGNTEMAMEQVTDERVREDLGQVIKAAYRARDLTRHLLAFGRRSGEVAGSVDLVALVEESREPVASMLPTTIALTIQSTVPSAMIRGDPAQLQLALSKVVQNAVEGMPRGGSLTIGVSQRTVVPSDQVPEVEPGEYFALTITDTGVGINADILPRMFDPFFTTKPVGRGSGLGLAMVYGTIRDHQGAILVTSVRGQGTVLSILLPPASVVSPSVVEAVR